MHIRYAEANDEVRWRELWGSYVEFYEANVPEHVTAATWSRILTPGSNVTGRMAVVDGKAQGFSVSVLHAGTWSTAPVCYLEDLFVSADARGGGLGRALIDDLVALGRREGWATLYWHTRAGNMTARRLYDCFTLADDFVRYRLSL